MSKKKIVRCRVLTTNGTPCKNKGLRNSAMLCNIHRKQPANRRIKVEVRQRKIFSWSERKAILATYGTACYLCGRLIDVNRLWHIDHVYPFSKGGTDRIENLRPTHVRCNRLKGTKKIDIVMLELSTGSIHRGVDNEI